MFAKGLYCCAYPVPEVAEHEVILVRIDARLAALRQQNIAERNEGVIQAVARHDQGIVLKLGRYGSDRRLDPRREESRVLLVGVNADEEVAGR